MVGEPTPALGPLPPVIPRADVPYAHLTSRLLTEHRDSISACIGRTGIGPQNAEHRVLYVRDSE